MDGLSLLDPLAWRPECLPEHPAYASGHALGWLYHSNKQASTNQFLSGRLYLAKSGWLLLSVPNALVRGVYDAMSVPGAELPRAGLMNVPNVDGELLNAHISVMNADEVAAIGADKITERGHSFGYSLGPLKELDVRNVAGISKVWAITITSPALADLRKSYGLSPLPKGDQPFHITVAVRRKGVLQDNGIAKGYETPAETPEEHRFSNPISRGELKAAAAAVSAPQPRVRVVMPYQGKYLMETLNNPKWPQNIGKRRFMGGGVEAGETPEQAASREIFEELGVKIKPTAFRMLGNDPREGWQHEHYLELLKHKLKPGNFNATVGSDAVVTLSHGLPEGDDYMGPDIKKLLAPVLKKTADLLPGGEADNKPDSQFPAKALAEGAKHEHEHTDNDQVAKEIAKDHLSEDPAYYVKQKALEHKQANQGSVYAQQFGNLLNFRQPIVYDHNKPVYQNIVDHLRKAQERADFVLASRNREHIYRTQLDPQYRYQMAQMAIHGTLPRMNPTDKAMQLYGNDIFDSVQQLAGAWSKKNAK
jgi:8-oxo-dGTP pyrophosphatase MutT (NUDIX family)